MISRIRKALDEKQEGFTLIELLVVIIIIGILAAIAIPVFLNQRKKAVDASMKSDARTVANEEETYFTDYQAYVQVAASNPASIGSDTVHLSTGNLATVSLNPGGRAGTFCVDISRAGTAQPASQTHWIYISDKGGLQATGVTVCS